MSITLLVANDGGHLMQLWALHKRLAATAECHWVTTRTPQTESLLNGESVTWVGPATTRDWRAAARNARALHAILRSYPVGRVVSTGSSLAVSALPLAAARGTPAHYIESVTRTDGLSLSGRIVSRVPGVRLYVQWPHLARGRWTFGGSVLEGYRLATVAAKRPRRIVVSLGTSAKFGFRRLLERLAGTIPAGVEVLWQTGCTDLTGLPIDGRRSVGAADLSTAIRAADAVVAHAGAGIALTALDAGKIPILVPRSASRGEHVDDHQRQIGRLLRELGLAVVVEAEEVTWATIEAVTGMRADLTQEPRSFELR